MDLTTGFSRSVFLAAIGLGAIVVGPSACGNSRALRDAAGEAQGTAGNNGASGGTGGSVDSGQGGDIGTGGIAGAGSGGSDTSGGRGGTASGTGGRGSGGSGTGGRMVGTGGENGSQTGGRGASGSGGSSACGVGRTFCDGRCVNTRTDPQNCTACGIRCQGATPYCNLGCKPNPCVLDGGACGNGGICCQGVCCGAGETCCGFDGPPGIYPLCFRPTAAEPSCPGGCSPLCQSDRNLKKDITAIDVDQILARLNQLPISTWTYLGEPNGVRHVGPMAQDFRAAFGLGSDDRTYHAIDGHGVALAAIQALDQHAQQQQRLIDALQRHSRALDRRLRALERPRIVKKHVKENAR